MEKKVFYSWQSDLPNKSNRGFLSDVLNKASKSLSAQEVGVETIIDRDTQNVSGSPDITNTIFKKITESSVFVADISIVGTFTNSLKKDKSTPNPNVLIELGYALRELGPEKTLLVFNEAFGKIENLPFDLRSKRIITYSYDGEAPTKETEKLRLQKILEVGILSAIQNDVQESKSTLFEQTKNAVRNNTPDSLILLRDFLEEIFHDFEKMAPLPPSQGGTVENLIDALSLTKERIANFATIADLIVRLEKEDFLIEVNRWFHFPGDNYFHVPGRENLRDDDFDFYRFLGHELFVVVVGLLIKERKWYLLEIFLKEKIPLEEVPGKGGPGYVDWCFLSKETRLLIQENTRTNQLSVRANLLKERYSGGELSKILPLKYFTEADFFLYLVSEYLAIDTEKISKKIWYPQSILYFSNSSIVLQHAESTAIAGRLANIFKANSIEALKNNLKRLEDLYMSRLPEMPYSSPFDEAFIDKIATQD